MKKREQIKDTDRILYHCTQRTGVYAWDSMACKGVFYHGLWIPIELALSTRKLRDWLSASQN